MTQRSHRCPSSSLELATHLLGVIDGEGRVRYVSPALPLTDEFRERVAGAGDPERRFRFTGACVEGDCIQWTGSRCRVIDKVVDALADAEVGVELRPCTIRSTCRWFAQSRAAACKACPLVVTESREPEPAA